MKKKSIVDITKVSTRQIIEMRQDLLDEDFRNKFPDGRYFVAVGSVYPMFADEPKIAVIGWMRDRNSNGRRSITVHMRYRVKYISPNVYTYEGPFFEVKDKPSRSNRSKGTKYFQTEEKAMEFALKNHGDLEIVEQALKYIRENKSKVPFRKPRT